ncbi:MAG: DUF2306 domain-containing protein [Balneola sp.]
MNYQFDVLGLIHFTSALFAMVVGMAVILFQKGTKRHVYLGYTYVVSMLILNATALMIFDLFGGFGPFHFMALFSLLTVIGGLVPAFLKKPKDKWLDMHYEFMNWSVVGLYAAFWSETFSRFFRFAGFWTLVIAATVLTVVLGGIILKMKKKKILSRITSTKKK